MRIIVVSDTHGREYRLRDIIAAQPTAEALIFLGDGAREVEEIMAEHQNIKFFAVAGNCDFGSLLPLFDIIKIGGKQIYLCHGHSHAVKSGLEEFTKHAQNLGVDIALYGHTHQADLTYIDGLHIINPGSVGRGVTKNSYATIDIVNGQIFPNIIKI